MGKHLGGGGTPEKKTLGHGSVSRDSTFEGSLNSFDSADFEVVWWGPKEQARLMMGCGPRQGYNLFQTERSAMTDEIQQMLV